MAQDVRGNQDSASWPASLDAVAAAPDHHLVILENEQVRVLDTRIAPGQRTPIHTHAWPSVLYVMSWSDFIRYDAHDTIVLDSRSFTASPAVGTALWSAPLGPHCAENVGDQELRVIAVELKISQSPSQ